MNDVPLLPLSFDRFPPNFPWTRIPMVARDTWFHILEKFPLRDRISRKTVFFRVQKGILIVPSLRVTGNVQRRLDCFHPLVDIPHIYPSSLTFAEGCTVFQLSTSESHALPQYQQWAYLDGGTVAPSCERRDTNQYASNFFKHRHHHCISDRR